MIAVMLVIFLLLIGCQNQETQSGFPIPDEHKAFLNSYGWEIDHSNYYKIYGYLPEIKANELSIYKEYVNSIKELTELDLSPYFNKQSVLEKGYVLKNTKSNFDVIKAHVYEVEGEVIEGYLVVYKKNDAKEIPMADKDIIVD